MKRFLGLMLLVTLSAVQSANAGCGGKKFFKRAAKQGCDVTYVNAAPIQGCGVTASPQNYAAFQTQTQYAAPAPTAFPPTPGKSAMPYPFPAPQ